MTETDLMQAIDAAHQAAECGDYYCGCWDGADGGGWKVSEDADWTTPPWRHGKAFVAALGERGYEIVRDDEETRAAFRIVCVAARIWVDEYGGLDRKGDVTDALAVLGRVVDRAEGNES